MEDDVEEEVSGPLGGAALEETFRLVEKDVGVGTKRLHLRERARWMG